jgi:hypothetical protein
MSLMSLLAQTGSARAEQPLQAGLEVARNEIVLDFPTSLSFELEASAPGPVEELYLNHGTNGRSCLDSFGRISIDPPGGSEIDTSWEWDFTQGGSLPSGAEIWWEWEITLAGGETLLTERQAYTFEDPRFSWKHTENERVSVYWYEGSSSFSAQLLDISGDSLDRLEGELGISIDDQIRLTIYPNSEDILGAYLYLSDWVGGLAVSEYNTLIIAIAPGMITWAEEVIPHEIAHLVVGSRTFNCLGISLPTWLSEGLAVAAEGEQEEGEYAGVLEHLADGTLPGLTTLTSGYSVNGDEARLSYAHSGAIVLYLIDTYGPEKMDELLRVMQTGKNANPALVEIYGLDTAEIDQAWRASLGYGEAPVPQGSTPTIKPTSIPTFALWTAPAAQASTTAVPTGTDLPATPTEAPPAATATNTPAAAEPTAKNSPLSCLGGSMIFFTGFSGIFVINGFWRKAKATALPER